MIINMHHTLLILVITHSYHVKTTAYSSIPQDIRLIKKPAHSSIPKDNRLMKKSTHSSFPNDIRLIKRLVSSIRLNLGYYSSNARLMNLDGIFGLRMIEGQLKILLPNKYKSMRHVLKGLVLKAKKIADDSLSHIYADDPIYYRNLNFLIEEPWWIKMPYKKLILVEIEQSIDESHKISEQFIDSCIHDLSLCLVSTNCSDFASSINYSDYILTHQLLFIMTAIQNNCSSILESKMFPLRVDFQLNRLCVKVFLEMKNKILNFEIHLQHDNFQDLFMEQQFICPTIGYYEFLHFYWLKLALSWQSRSGCWGNFTHLETQNFHRRLLYEKELNDGCLSHKTCVGIGVVIQYLRFLLTTINSPANFLSDSPSNFSPFRYLFRNDDATVASLQKRKNKYLISDEFPKDSNIFTDSTYFIDTALHRRISNETLLRSNLNFVMDLKSLMTGLVKCLFLLLLLYYFGKVILKNLFALLYYRLLVFKMFIRV